MATYWTDDVGPPWVAENDRLDERLGLLTNALVGALAPVAGEAVLDIGCGAGGSSVEIARQLGGAGRLVAADISSTMLAAARGRPVDEDAATISWLEADAQTHPFELRSFDAVVSRFGVMFFEDPTEAFENLRRALAPGGRLVLMCWRGPRANPWFFVGVDELRDLVDFPEAPEPNAPGPFGLADSERTRRLLEDAGFGSVEVEAVDSEMPFSGSVDDMVSHLMTIGPVGGALRAMEDRASREDRVRERLREVVEVMEGESGLANPAAVWLVRARRLEARAPRTRMEN